jgi:hypothetical protein
MKNCYRDVQSTKGECHNGEDTSGVELLDEDGDRHSKSERWSWGHHPCDIVSGHTRKKEHRRQ